MYIKSWALCLILSFSLLGCSEPLPADKSQYAGTWISADSRINLVITPEGLIEYSNQQPGKSTSVSSPIKSFNEHGFEAGVGPLTTTFKVAQVPTQDSQGNWFMIVDGFTLAKTQLSASSD